MPADDNKAESRPDTGNFNWELIKYQIKQLEDGLKESFGKLEEKQEKGFSSLEKKITCVQEKTDSIEKRMVAVEEREKSRDDTVKITLSNHHNDIESLKKRSNAWDGINSALVVIGTAIGILK